MGLTIEADETKAVPHNIVLALTCDISGCSPTHGHFTSADGFIGAYRKAMNAGWKDTQGPQGRIFLCPACSGKI